MELPAEYPDSSETTKDKCRRRSQSLITVDRKACLAWVSQCGKICLKWNMNLKLKQFIRTWWAHNVLRNPFFLRISVYLVLLVCCLTSLVNSWYILWYMATVVFFVVRRNEGIYRWQCHLKAPIEPFGRHFDFSQLKQAPSSRVLCVTLPVKSAGNLNFWMWSLH